MSWHTSCRATTQYRFCGLGCHVPRRWTSAPGGDHHAAARCVHLRRRPHWSVRACVVRVPAGHPCLAARDDGCNCSLSAGGRVSMGQQHPPPSSPGCQHQHPSAHSTSQAVAAHQVPEDGLDLVLLIWHEPVLRHPSAKHMIPSSWCCRMHETRRFGRPEGIIHDVTIAASIRRQRLCTCRS